MTKEKDFAKRMSELLFDMRNEDLANTMVFDDDDQQIPVDFIDGILENPDHINVIKEKIFTSVLVAVSHSPNSFNTDDNGNYVYTAPDTYDHSYVVDHYIQACYANTQTKTVYVCMSCGSDAVQVKSWTRPNEGHKFVDEIEGDELGWCDDCQQTVDVQTAELKRHAEVVGYQVVGQDSSPVEGEIHPHMDASFCLYSLSQANELLNLGNEHGYWRLLTIWSGDVEEPTLMFDGDPR